MCVCVCVSNISDHLMLLTDHIHTVRGIGTVFFWWLPRVLLHGCGHGCRGLLDAGQ